MVIQLVVGAILLAVGCVLHASILDFAAHWVRRMLAPMEVRPRAVIRLVLLVGAALLAFLSHVIQVWLWALFYMAVGEFRHLEEALYFSTVTFTTLGFGDVTVSDTWRLLSSFESATGLFLFGLSTAFLYEIMRIIWRHRAPAEE